MNFFRSSAGTFLITGLIFLAGFIFFTPVHDDYGSFLMSLASGQFSDFSFVDLHYQGFVGVHRVYELLYGALPVYNWMSIFFISFEFISLYLFLSAVRRVIRLRTQNEKLVLLIQLLFGVLFIENVISLSHTRFSLLFCGLGLFNLAFDRDIKWGSSISYMLLFVIGMLHRPESSMGMILLVSIGYLISDFRPVYLAKRFSIPILSTIILLGIIANNWEHTQIFMEKIEPEIEYKMMDKRVVPLSEMKTAADTVKYELSTRGMWFDPRVLTPDFLRSIQLPGMNLSADHAEQVCCHILDQYRRCLLIPGMIAVFILFSFFNPSCRKARVRIILFQMMTFGIVFALDYNGFLVAGRHFLNMQLMGLLICMYYLFDTGEIAEPLITDHKILSGVSLLVIVSTSIVMIINVKKSNEYQVTGTECYEKTMRTIEQQYNNRVIAVTMSDFYLFDHKFSIYNKNYTANKYIMYDMFTYSLIPEYVAYLRRISGCDPMDPVAFYTWLTKKDALYMANPDRFELTEKYMRLIHRLPIQFEPLQDWRCPSCMNATNLSEFEMRAVHQGNSLDAK